MQREEHAAEIVQLWASKKECRLFRKFVADAAVNSRVGHRARISALSFFLDIGFWDSKMHLHRPKNEARLAYALRHRHNSEPVSDPKISTDTSRSWRGVCLHIARVR